MKTAYPNGDRIYWGDVIRKTRCTSGIVSKSSTGHSDTTLYYPESPAYPKTMQQFLLENDSAYRRWRTRKLQGYPTRTEQLIVTVQKPHQLTSAEKASLLQVCEKTNLVIYRTEHDHAWGKNMVAAIARQLGLSRMDANFCADRDRISSIQVMNEGPGSTYIPYTNQPLNWHTDGYYNQDAQRIRAFLMHCVRPASTGGENTYLDPEILYILLRDQNPEHIKALMDSEAMTIPPNPENKERQHMAKSGPVYMPDEPTQALYMRYTARTRNVAWKDSFAMHQARHSLLEILNDSEYRFRYRLQSGEGVVCNNVLHNRTMFTDRPGSRRLLYRARFYERVPGSSPVSDTSPVCNAVAQ